MIREQADRCRDILRDMGRAGKDDLHLRQAPLSAVLSEAAEPHLDRGKELVFDERPELEDAADQPSVLRKPEIIHGLRNLIQNAVDFADSTVWIESSWTPDLISVRIMDDGKGFPAHLIGRIGDPFMRWRRDEAGKKARPGYEGMGLGLFIAKTLLERSGGELNFANGPGRRSNADAGASQKGAIVEVRWERRMIDAKAEENIVPIGLNQHIQA